MDRTASLPENKLPDQRTVTRLLALVIVLSVIIRGFFAYILELGNDEVYYWTYALYPAPGHFDHPPMVGLTIQAFSLNLHFNSELFVRLGSVILGGVNTWMIYLIGKTVKNRLTGLYAALLYNTSVYCFVIAGIFILPDTPQLFFWLVSLYMLLTALPDRGISRRSKNILFYAGIPLGLALLSKYTSVFLWAGAGIYILLYNRKWLRTRELYAAVLISLIIFSPVVFWNIENKFISFTFQSERVSFFGSGLQPRYFFTELFGQILYNNPVNFVLIIVALVAMWRKKFFIPPDYRRLLLATSLPLIGLFLFFALFRRTLPHWTGPAYISLIVVAAVYLSGKAARHKHISRLPVPVAVAASVLLLALVLGLFQIKWGIFSNPRATDPTQLGKNDVTLDMYGWRQFEYKFSELADHDLYTHNMPADAPIVTYRWFPAAHLDYYVAQPRGMNLIAIGSLENLHKYAWINRMRPELYPGADAYYITNSRDFHDPHPSMETYFTSIDPPSVIRIYKRHKHVENFFVYRLRNCKKVPPDVLESFGLPRASIPAQQPPLPH